MGGGGGVYMVGLRKISADVPEVFFERKQHFGDVSWAQIIKEGLETLELKETLITGVVHDFQWRYDCREILRRCVDHELKKR